MINAFLIGSELTLDLWEDSRSHLIRIATEYGKIIQDYQIGSFKICLVGNDIAPNIANGSYSLTIANNFSHDYRWDRFLKIEFIDDQLYIENDYAGTIPFYYSLRNGFIASNIEPCVFLGSGSSIDDISPQNIFGFLKYSHFIWDETAWKHIFQILPDSRYIFTDDGRIKSSEYLATVRATNERCQLSDKKISTQLFELNNNLIRRNLSDVENIILPLSSGYDSRMIFAVLANDSILAKRTRCFTYGSDNSVETTCAQRLSRMKDVFWKRIEMPCRFLQLRYQKEVSNVFGASLHMHGMYQIEFYEQIKLQCGIPPGSVLTSGFMTGVPAGQHNGLLRIQDSTSSLTHAMNRFSQSKAWSDDALRRLPIFNGQDFADVMESRFRSAFNRFDGDIHQKAVMFDIWTRQRNFVGYYPRTLEWLTPISSPHMNTDYANFFMSLSREHLWNRRAVELMFLNHYPDISRIASNSNGLNAIGSRVETALFFISRLLNKCKLPNPLPRRYRNSQFDFDFQAINNSQEESFYPLFGNKVSLHAFIESMGGVEFFRDCFRRALSGDTHAYAQVVAIQSIAHNGLLGRHC